MSDDEQQYSEVICCSRYGRIAVDDGSVTIKCIDCERAFDGIVNENQLPIHLKPGAA